MLLRLQSSDKEAEGLYYSQNKNTDQLHGYYTADLHLCFRICKNCVFLSCCSKVLQQSCFSWPNLGACVHVFQFELCHEKTNVLVCTLV